MVISGGNIISAEAAAAAAAAVAAAAAATDCGRTADEQGLMNSEVGAAM